MKILITGGSSGIGAACAKEMASGNEIFLVYNNGEKNACEVAKEIAKMGGRCYTIKADISSDKGCEECIAKVKEQSNSLDALVNCAGGLINRLKTPELTWQGMQDVFALNVFGLMKITSLSIPLLRNGTNASVINFTSGAIISGSTGAPLYASAKGAVDVFTKGLSKELAPQIRVNSVAPGVVITPFHDGRTTSDTIEGWAKSNPMKKNGTPKDIANAVRFCIENKFLNGSSIEIDGGKKGL